MFSPTVAANEGGRDLIFRVGRHRTLSRQTSSTNITPSWGVNFQEDLELLELTLPPKTVLTDCFDASPPSKKEIMSNSALKILLALMVAITALVAQPVFGQAQTLVITENSSTSLTAILNGTTSLNVNNGATADVWFITLAGVGGSQQIWMEPGDTGVFNTVTPQLLIPTSRLRIISDEPVGGITGLADGTPDTTHFTLNGNPLSVTFFDKGDVATVPDAGTSFSLLGVSLMGLAFLRRKFC